MEPGSTAVLHTPPHMKVGNNRFGQMGTEDTSQRVSSSAGKKNRPKECVTVPFLPFVQLRGLPWSRKHAQFLWHALPSRLCWQLCVAVACPLWQILVLSCVSYCMPPNL